MTTLAPNRYAGHRFPLSLRMVEEILAARGIVSHEAVRQWALKFGQGFANEVRRRLPRAGDKWHLDEVVIKIAGTTHWLWRAVAAARNYPMLHCCISAGGRCTCSED